jgi:hypothetical protein
VVPLYALPGVEWEEGTFDPAAEEGEVEYEAGAEPNFDHINRSRAALGVPPLRRVRRMVGPWEEVKE